MKSDIRQFNNCNMKKKMLRRPGIETRSTAWKAAMLTFTPSTPCRKPSSFEENFKRRGEKICKYGENKKFVPVRCGIQTHAHNCGPE